MFSVVIPTKDEEAHLPHLLRSIKNQTLQPTEVIIADAHSTDHTREIAVSFGARVVDGGMPGAGRNAGAAVAIAENLVFLDADVQLQDGKFFEHCIGEFFERGLDVATCEAVPLNGTKRDEYLHRAYNLYVRACGAVIPHAAGFCIFATRRMHELIGGFDETIQFCEDHDYAKRAARIGRFGYLTSATIPVSTRRLDRDGRMRTFMRFALAELHLNTIGPIRHGGFGYTFGHKQKTHAQDH